MRVLVTRPEHSARHTAARLEALGHAPIMLPLTKAAHDPQAAEAALAGPHRALAITSAEAVRAISGLTPFLSEPMFAVGRATAEAAENQGFSNVHTGSGTGSGLAELIAGFPSQSTDPLLYLAGSPRSSSFEESLGARNIPLTVAEVYRMLPIAYDQSALETAFVQARPNAVLLYSGQNAHLFFELAAPFRRALDELLVLGISESVLEAVPPNFRLKIKIAKRPDEEGLFALL
ncbi:uroporphyrinogen-III synthase [Rhizobium deserti]|uniref:Uroporphyrinogen-III synthase n=1 Tax=Rhizobium deserti TaxID=2547961 RepID=A0A4R5UG36_9HYPH|nr:uroporphyrinogen-III synthase [Rhizobium deserti]TDK34483.1 uroporphyrinogen-III synthase [Rhizobium deserti]